MAKVAPLNQIESLANTASAKQALNENFEAIEDAFVNTLSRDGSTPNQMEADIDLNSNDLLNVGTIDANQILHNGVPIEQEVAYGSVVYLTEDGNGSQTNYPLAVHPGSLGNLEVSVDGEVLRPGLDYNLVGSELVFVVAPASGTDNILIRYAIALPLGTLDANSVLYEVPSSGDGTSVGAFLDLLDGDDGADNVGYTPTSTGIVGTTKSFLDSLWTAGANTGAALIRFLQAGVGAVARPLQDKMRDTVSIKDFGAICDGVNDDSDAINLALSSGASKVKFVGNCLVSKPLYYPGNITIEFDRAATITPVPIASFEKLILNGTDWGYAIFMNVNWQSATIIDENVVFINPRCAPAVAWNGHFVASRKVRNIQCIGSYAKNVDDVFSSMACRDVIVRDGWCDTIANCAYDFWEGPARITVVNNTTINANAGVNFNAIDTFGGGGFVADTLLVQGNRFFSSASSAVFVAPLGNTSFCTNVKILDNFIDQANVAFGTGGGGQAWGGITVQRTSVTDIRGNTLSRIGANAAPIIVSIDGGGESQETLVSENTIVNSTLGAGGYFIQCYGARSTVRDNIAATSSAGVGVAVNYPTTVVGPNVMTGATVPVLNQNPGGGATSPALQLDRDTVNGRWESPQRFKGFVFQPKVSYAIASQGSNAATALPLTSPLNYVSSGVASPGGVTLPSIPTNQFAGQEYIVWNNSGVGITVYASAGDTIGGAASVTVATSNKVRLIALTANFWMIAGT